jgi:hypothetical protein
MCKAFFLLQVPCCLQIFSGRDAFLDFRTGDLFEMDCTLIGVTLFRDPFLGLFLLIINILELIILTGLIRLC